MALPPESLDELLPLAHVGVIAEVKKILKRNKQDFVPAPDDPEVVNTPRHLPEQSILLTIKSTLFGTLPIKGQEIEVIKPAGAYSLREGVEGSFLLLTEEGQAPSILGRYGPDNYSSRALEAAIKAHNRT